MKKRLYLKHLCFLFGLLFVLSACSAEKSCDFEMGNGEKILQGKGYESAVFPGYGRMRAGFCEHGFMDMGGWEMLHGAAGRISGDGGAQ